MEIENKNNNNNNESTTKKPHIAILSGPGMGHIIPLLELAKKLAMDHGFHVSFLIFSTGSPPAQNQLLKSPSIPPDVEIVHLPEIKNPSFIHDEKLDVIVRLLFILRETITKFLKSTLTCLQYGLPRALIVDMFCHDAFDTVKELSIPTYVFYTASALFLTWALYCPTFDQSVHGDYSGLPETLRTPSSNHDLSVKDLMDSGLLIREFIRYANRVVEADGILINTWDDLEKSSIIALRENPFYVNLKTPPIYPIGPVIKSKANDDHDFECLKWLNNQPKHSVLFVSFGSGGTLTNEQMTELAYGLQQSKQRFIWVVKEPSNFSKSGSFFNVGTDASDPKSYLPDGFAKKIETFGKIVANWAPQMEVLSHESTGGFLTHCGWNSFLESIVNGVPMICWPLFADQMMNANMISNELGVGVRVETKTNAVGRDEVERVVRTVMEGEQGNIMRRRASVLQESALKSQVGASLDTLFSWVEAEKLGKQE